jgi:hypothetical protein
MVKVKFIALVILGCSGCSSEPFDLCERVEIGMTESQIIQILGKPYSQSQEESADISKGMMYKNEAIPAVFVLAFKKTEQNIFVLDYCNAI